MRELRINKRNLRDAKLVDVTPPPLAPGAARLELDVFALTSNNVTYAAMGEGMLGYWDFFPGPEGFGKVPVWGFGTVAESNAPEIAVGSRFYGYYPLAETLDVIPKKTPTGFIDTATHRAPKAVLYNVYTDTNVDPIYDPNYESKRSCARSTAPAGGRLISSSKATQSPSCSQAPHPRRRSPPRISCATSVAPRSSVSPQQATKATCASAASVIASCHTATLLHSKSKRRRPTSTSSAAPNSTPLCIAHSAPRSPEASLLV